MMIWVISEPSGSFKKDNDDTMLVIRDVRRPENHQGNDSTFLKSGQKVTSFSVVLSSVAIAVVKTRLCEK